MEEISAKVNEERFTNSISKTEFLNDPDLLADIGILCEGPAVSSILDGTYTPAPHLNWFSKKLIEFMEMPEIIKENPMPKPTISTAEHIKGWRKAKESTSSDPRTPDFSHYISASYDKILADMDATLREVPLQYGFAPDEWNPMADCSIPKRKT